MRRRLSGLAQVLAIGVVMLFAALDAEAQPTGRAPRVGYLMER